ncbi:MAG: orotidine-5'-phosphate decarboxylase [Gammaproteobacteria bacterium]|nr:orotidine-5'-phosphate decarboxylase [Gammaproteobacteria bacterium]
MLRASATAHGSLVCVGLDPEPARFPVHLRGRPRAILEFSRAIVDATCDLVCAYKPQIAHFAAERAEEQLEELIGYIQEHAPSVPVILDAKRGDIGSTAGRYAREAFERYRADAVTVNPYLGHDSVEPFLAHADKGVVVLCRTSNPGARELQDLEIGGRRLYRIVAERVATEWNARGNCLLVVGATYPRELAEIRSCTGSMPFLVPGVGAQGADVAEVLANGQAPGGGGLIISSSRAILYAGTGEDFAAAARHATLALRDQIELARAT